jgi:TIR domain
MAGRGREGDFFISYTQADRAWAEWIAWLLEEDHHRVLIQAWDFVGGSNWVQRMRDGVLGAGRTVAVLSPDYLQSEFGTAEWTAAWSTDPLAAERAGALHPRGIFHAGMAPARDPKYTVIPQRQRLQCPAHDFQRTERMVSGERVSAARRKPAPDDHTGGKRE